MTTPRAVLMQAVFTRFSSRSDGSVGFTGCTPELNTTEKVALMDLHGKNVKVLIQPTDDTPEAMMEVKGELGFKTPGQRLRAVIFILFKQATESGRIKGVMFEAFYGEVMEKFIADIKNQLEPEHA